MLPQARLKMQDTCLTSQGSNFFDYNKFVGQVCSILQIKFAGRVCAQLALGLSVIVESDMIGEGAPVSTDLWAGG